MSEVLEIILGVLGFPWWFWALLIGVGGLFVGYSLGSFTIAGIGGLSLFVGAFGALRKIS